MNVDLKGLGAQLATEPSMHLDVVFEILRWLAPPDLLSLLPASRKFHNILAHKSSKWIWKQSFENIRPYPFSVSPETAEKMKPGMFPDENYIRWAKLLFSTSCEVCLKKTNSDQWPRLLSRLCSKCFKQQFKRVEPVDWFKDHSLDLLAKTGLSNNVSFRVLQDRGWWPWDSEFVLVSEVDAITQELLRLDNDPDKLAKYTVQKQREAKTKDELHTICRSWQIQLDALKRFEHDQACDLRTATILAKLREIGWGPELDLMQEKDKALLMQNDMIRQARPLTDCLWRNLKPKIIALMEEIKAKRLASINPPSKGRKRK